MSKTTKKNTISASALAPNIASEGLGIATRFFYWVGALPECPSEYVTIGGVCFPKMTEKLQRMPGKASKQRVPGIGAVVPLSPAQLRGIIERLPRTVVRFNSAAPEPIERANGGELLFDAAGVRRRGRLITIPTREEVEDAIKRGKPTRAYNEGPFDEPVSKYIFAKLCLNQERGERGDVYPATLADVGLELPDGFDVNPQSAELELE